MHFKYQEWSSPLLFKGDAKTTHSQSMLETFSSVLR